jgi:hypothetical protein
VFVFPTEAAGDWTAHYEINVQQYACAGLNFGTYYDRSPIIAYDGTEPPAYTMSSYTPSTVPACRTQHLWSADGASLYDAMGLEFTLLRFDPAVKVVPLALAAGERKMPLRVIDVVAPVKVAQAGALVLSRPDQHVGLARPLRASPSAGLDRPYPRRLTPGRSGSVLISLPVLISLRSQRSIPSGRRAGAGPSDP